MKPRFIFHPILIALYPGVSLYITNYALIRFNQTVLSFGIILFALAIIWLLTKKLLRNPDKAALIVSAFFMLFFSYGHFITASAYYVYKLWHTDLGIFYRFSSTLSMSVFLAVWGLIFALIAFLTVKSKRDFHAVTSYMNVLSFVLLALSFYKAADTILDEQATLRKMAEMPNIGLSDEDVTLSPRNVNALPDIYYIVLDGYARSDVMWDIYGYDNSGFIDFLNGQGFYVADRAHSNYNYTYVSLTSTLNLIYLTDLTSYYEPTETSTYPVRAMFENNIVSRVLKNSGYSIVSLPSSADFLPQFRSDIRLTPPLSLGSFDIQILNSTPFRFLLRGVLYDLHRQWVRYQFSAVPEATPDVSPKFVFAHFIQPHPPFVFKGNGDPIDPAWEFTFFDGDDLTRWFGRDFYVAGYSEQAIYTTSQVQLMIEDLMALDPRPIIILQADHGPGSQHDGMNVDLADVNERFAILNAYYFPDQNYDSLYGSVTPVNSFRIVFNQFLGADLALLEDKSYWINPKLPFNPIDISGRLTAP